MAEHQGLVIVDAWDYDAYIKKRNEIPYSQECAKDGSEFSIFLNRVCEKERANGTTIIFDIGFNKLIDKITVDEKTDLILPYMYENNYMNIIKERKINELYFCGFHFGLCIHDKIANVSESTDYNGKLGIIINLSMLLPVDTFKNKFERFHKPNKPRYKPNHAWDYYLWTPKCEFEKIDISFP
tara:strand:+ start:197 stop:745 length:549 start_codon:yes stop_codon:yes gene_type:complete